MQHYQLIASFVHGNALGVVLEPAGIANYFAKDERPESWVVRIGPLVPEAAIGTEFPKEDYEKVVADLKKFCADHGIGDYLSHQERPAPPRSAWPEWLRKGLFCFPGIR